MRAHIVQNRKLGVELLFGKNLAGEDSAFLEMYGNSYTCYSRTEAQHLANWLKTRAIPALEAFAKANKK
jgi:hypothetical protein